MTRPIDPNELCMLTRLFWPDAFGGVERRTFSMARAFAAAGMDLSVITSTGSEQEARSGVLEPGFCVQRMPAPTIGWRWRWRDRVLADWWARALRSHRPDGWVWATDVVAAAGAVRAGLSHRLIFNPPWSAAGMHSVWRANDDLPTLRCRAGLRRAERTAYRHAHTVVASSQNLIDQLAAAHGERDRVHVVPHGVEPPAEPMMTRDAARRSLGVDASGFVVGVVCRVEPVKDLPFLLRAVREAGSAVGRLLIVGDGPQRAEIESLAAAWGLADRVTWTGRLNEPTVAYRAMDVSVLPSVGESFGNVVLESMAAGTPVIGRRRCGDPACPVLVANDEIIEHGRSGLLVDSHDPADMADAFRRLAGNREQLDTLARGARVQARRFTWRRATDRYLRIMGRAAQPADPLPAGQAA